MSHSARKGKRSTGRARENEVVNRAAKRAQKSNEKHSAAETLKEEVEGGVAHRVSYSLTFL